MKQYEIEERNDWEGETFSYIVELTEEQFNKIQKLFEGDEFEEVCSISECDYTKEQVDLINDKSSNSYMDRIAFYKLDPETDLENSEYNDFPYKGNGLIRIR